METNTATTAVARGAGAAVETGRRRPARGRPGLTLLAVALGVMMVALDGTIVAVANPAIQEHLNASLAGIQWVTNAYLLALAVSLMTMGKLGDRFGHKKVFMTGVTGFAFSSAAIGLSGTLASSLGLVIAFRALQGVFGAMLQPTALALLRNTFPPEKLNRAIGVWGAVIGASTAAGPIVGGLLVQHISWESCFYVNVPVGAAALIMSLIVLRETPRSPAASSFDIPGIAALSGALFLLIWGLIKGSSYGWGSARPPRQQRRRSRPRRDLTPASSCDAGPLIGVQRHTIVKGTASVRRGRRVSGSSVRRGTWSSAPGSALAWARRTSCSWASVWMRCT